MKIEIIYDGSEKQNSSCRLELGGLGDKDIIVLDEEPSWIILNHHEP